MNPKSVRDLLVQLGLTAGLGASITGCNTISNAVSIRDAGADVSNGQGVGGTGGEGGQSGMSGSGGAGGTTWSGNGAISGTAAATWIGMGNAGGPWIQDASGETQSVDAGPDSDGLVSVDLASERTDAESEGN
jgi:hypothetical protein